LVVSIDLRLRHVWPRRASRRVSSDAGVLVHAVMLSRPHLDAYRELV
jgi:hypothetical protein